MCVLFSLTPQGAFSRVFSRMYALTLGPAVLGLHLQEQRYQPGGELTEVQSKTLARLSPGVVESVRKSKKT